MDQSHQLLHDTATAVSTCPWLGVVYPLATMDQHPVLVKFIHGKPADERNAFSDLSGVFD